MKQRPEDLILPRNMLHSNYFEEAQILNLMPIAVAVYDASGILVNYNHKAVEIWGRKPKLGNQDERFCGSSTLYEIDGGIMPHDSSPVAACLTGGLARQNIKLVIERPDRTRVFVKMDISPMFDEEGNLIGVINCFSEITDHKQIPADNAKKRLLEVLKETALLEGEKPYWNIIQGIPAAIYTTDKEGYITMYNEAAVRLWGREPEIGKDLWCGSWKIFNPDGSELSLDNCPMARTLREGRPVIGEEILVVRPDGSIRNIAPHPQPIFSESGTLIGAVNMLVDITDIRVVQQVLEESEAKYRQLSASLEQIIDEKIGDLKRNNEELHRSEERYHKMIEEVEDYAIILLDKNGLIQNWNRGAEKIKGYREDEIVGKSFSEFYLPADREAKLPDTLLQHARETGKAIHEGWRKRKNGSQFWGSIVLTALHDDHDNIIGFSKVTRDLTERKIAEDKAREYSTELEFQNKELEQFVYAASHDLKEPLRKIHFYNCSISESEANHLDEKSREYLNRSINAVRRMTDLIEDLLMYSRTTSSIDSYQEVDLNEIIEEIALLHKDEFEQKNIVMEIQSLPVLWGVPFQFKQLMANLISNAVKYRHPERQLAIKITNEAIVKGYQINHHEVQADQQYHHISVGDNGIGFEGQYSEKIFEIFQRLSNHSGAKGSGIGLAICKKIVQNHRGFITAYGQVNGGAKFDIYIPVAGSSV